MDLRLHEYPERANEQVAQTFAEVSEMQSSVSSGFKIRHSPPDAPKEGGRIHPHVDSSGTEAVILVNVEGACDFIIGGKENCEHQRTKEAWCRGTAHKGGANPNPPHWCHQEDCQDRYAVPRRRKATMLTGIMVDDDLLIDRMCARCAKGAQRPRECRGCTTYRLEPGDALIFHGDEKTGVVHGVDRVVAATRIHAATKASII